ncbi:hypothetical protein PV328_002084 [Microctonus aethiopoides]|uniref:Protein-lysine N-methyltransferase SMYD4 n=1 Tax=Microctonus aethiopoides TaxID=144406 RepID=A0AA39KY05_9HYME|nr:hypothetical protein PV328_002084 [Microctonus aethiopoides]
MQWQSVLEFIHRKLRTTNLYKEFNNKQNEHEVMALMMSNDIVGELLTLWLEKQSELKIQKCSKKAKSFKNEGNEFFKKKNYLTSVELYTTSAKYAIFDNGDYSISLANRSAALFHMGEYESCLEDIDVALASNYPTELRPKLHLRAAQCWIKLYDASRADEQLTEAQNLITIDENISADDRENVMRNIGKLTMEMNELLEQKVRKFPDVIKWSPEDLLPPNPMYSSASSVLTRDYSPTRGRYVKTKSAIKRGDVLYVEKPFAFVTLDHVVSNLICVHCCNHIANTGYPCRGCPHVLYCSKKCWSISWLSYHKWECVGYEMSIWKQIGIAHLAVKVFFSSIEIHDNTKFNEVQKLVTNIDKLSTDDLIIYSITARMLVQYLEVYTNVLSTIDMKKCLVDKFMNEEFTISSDVSCHEGKKLFVGTLLLRHMLQLIANGHAITRLNLTDAEGANIFEEQQQRVAVGIYPSVSMMNHSCDPNIMNTFWNDYLIVKAVRNIPAGGEIFNCYGPHFRRMGLKERQDALKNQYCFTCQCEPCTDPELQHFLDRFDALKCLNCAGPLSDVDLNSFKCLNCNLICTADVKNRADDLNNATTLFNLAQDFMQQGKNDEALDHLERCLKIRQKWLFKYHDDLTITYDSLGKVCVAMSQWCDSISYLETSILAVEEKFGLDSIEVANELNKITDICIQYLQRTPDRKSSSYRDIGKKTQRFLRRAEKIMSMISGPWSEAYQEISNKERELSGMLQSLRI